jgi:chaperone BCS1
MASPLMASPLMARDLSHNPFQSLRSGYNLAMYTVKDILGLDPVIVVNISIIFAAISTVGRYVTGYLYHYLKMVFISSVRIHEEDHLYRYIMKWMTDNHLSKRAFRSVKANTVQKTTIDDEEEAFKGMDDDSKDSNTLISYRTMMGRNPIRFAPYEVSHMFIHKRNIFLFRHGLRSVPHMRGAIPFKFSGELTVECLGRSLDPVKALLEEAQTYYLEKTMSTTTVFRANGPHWSRITARPSRDIETVILEKTKKQTLLQDINEYLHPRTRRWYANHGIPYRRGYLFSGPPGCGKTSLTAAIAGVFGLDIYVLSLLDPYINEDCLVRLFSSVPSRCIILLEDVDAAGLRRANDPKFKKQLRETAAEKEDKAAKPAVQISLSGLLNAIDGVSSSEGRILVMTTNKPKDLDQALVRPGRVDLHVHFSLPHREEIIEMFLSMYRDIDGQVETGIQAEALLAQMSTSSQDQAPASKDAEKEVPVPESTTPTKKQLEVLAGKFAHELPEERLSLAAVQGYLLRHKHDPEMAVRNAKAWGEESLREIRELEEEE